MIASIAVSLNGIASTMKDYMRNTRNAQKTRRVCFVFRGNFMLRTDGCHVRVIEFLEKLHNEKVALVVYSDDLSGHWRWSDQDASEFRARYPNFELVIETQSSIQAFVDRLASLMRAVGLIFGHIVALSH